MIAFKLDGKKIDLDVWGPPERLVESIQQYAEAGATTVIVRFASFDPMGQFDTFLEEVVPRI